MGEYEAVVEGRKDGSGASLLSLVSFCLLSFGELLKMPCSIYQVTSTFATDDGERFQENVFLLYT